MNDVPEPAYDFIVVGSGAGGGPVACRLARAGHSVLLLEAGGDRTPTADLYDVPAFHARASEDPAISWDFQVRHHAADALQARDSKHEPEDGTGRPVVWYPRASVLGGCTAHHALITVYPHDGDWNAIADDTGDDSWAAPRMRDLFRRRILAKLDRRDGEGWLPTATADPTLVLGDTELLRVILQAAADSLLDVLLARFGNPLDILRDLLRDPGELTIALLRAPGNPLAAVREFLLRRLDPNDERLGKREGLFAVPLSMRDGRRHGPAEFIRATASDPQSSLRVQTHAFVTRVLFAEGQHPPTAIGVEYLQYVQGQAVYRASPLPAAQAPARLLAHARREVILAGGTFNTPQILMLSGIGPRAELDRVGIPTVQALEGVGRNLQDRYEIGAIFEAGEDFALLRGCPFAPGPAEADPCLARWRNGERSPYATNGAALSVVRRSSVAGADPDLFLFGLPAYFKGYFRCYSEELLRRRDLFTWAILAGHTRNRAGSVTLRSADPFDRPAIDFHYFAEGGEEDLTALAEGLGFAREMMGRVRALSGGGWAEVLPGPDVRTEAEVRDFLRREAWGHHACGTCAIGKEGAPGAVLDSKLRVQGVRGLRVVDASVFPKIPGFFIATAIYLVAEKAADDILEAASA